MKLSLQFEDFFLTLTFPIKKIKRLVKKSFSCYHVYRWRNLHKILKEHSIFSCWVLPIWIWFHLNHCWVRWFSFILILWIVRIVKGRLLLLKIELKNPSCSYSRLPSIKKFGSTQLLNVPICNCIKCLFAPQAF